MNSQQGVAKRPLHQYLTAQLDPSPAQIERGSHLLVRALLLLILLRLLQPAPVLITTGPRQTVMTQHPAVGVHTRLTDEVEEWKIKRTLELVREMGAPWIVEFFPWAYYQAENREIAWSHPDLVVSHAHAQGLTIVARLGLTPGWARPPDTPLTYLDEESYADFASFAAAFAARYRDEVDYLIIGNEPNLSYEWGYRSTTAQDYVNLLQVVYPAVKAANPDVQILAGALAPTLEPEGSPWGLNDLQYLENMYEAGAAEYFDGLAVHAYGLTFPAGSEPDPAVLNFRRVELVREVMESHGDGEKSIFITETGWNDHPRWTMAVTPGQRIQNTVDALQIAEEEWPFVKMIAIWSFRYPAPTKSYMDYYTLVTPEFVRKPIYDVIKDYATKDKLPPT
ncbi:MAG: cellulase family glycosylhydrolase [Candidatus Promineifilaceae bacterium]|nr:cellulase family glycosylhydrolase [Candidatus Promineifilaceae bacterium]